ncbi:MATE family efflux transporter [Photobacterium damselae]|uniref:MATE family efflux transporter n=1 Tax=Photobacterium damselae TaxID=38293 RepID=UPI0012477B6F|nr:MATE family efflux transporter [Photobacterium damselae]KAB1182951.1 MATE family efflux transporter [Photobacterium damselae subsp. damselae]MBF7101602.1 MATE family efflux transporter [Photobacterium damselae]
MELDVHKTTQRVAWNTFASYMKIIISAMVALFSVRYLIDALGVDNYGIYSLIAGVITLLSFINSAMTVSTQRYLSYYKGIDDINIQSKIFKNSLLLHVIIGFVLVLLLLSITPFLFGNALNIEKSLINSSMYLYMGMVASVFFTIISVPFNAILIANENLFIDSLIIITKSILMLVVSIGLSFFNEQDRMGVFGFGLMILNALIFILYALYASIKYEECTLRARLDFGLLKELASFAIWSLYTNICYVLNTQGVNILLNKYFGIKINAAYGIAFQINGQVKNLSQSLLSAINPQIMKSEGMCNRDRTLKVSIIATKMGFFLVAIVSIPCFFVMHDLIKLWLGIVPDYVVIFCLCFLTTTLINQLTVGITPAIQAIGKIKRFQMIIGTTALFLLPVAYFCLLNGLSIYSILLLIVFIEAITGLLKIKIYTDVFDVSFLWYSKEIILKLLFSFFLSVLFVCVFYYLANIKNFVFVIIFSFLIYIPNFYFLSLSYDEKEYISKLYSRMIRR